jgi:hypothetical protein
MQELGLGGKSLKFKGDEAFIITFTLDFLLHMQFEFKNSFVLY